MIDYPLVGGAEPIGICTAETCDNPAYRTLGSQPTCAAHIHAFREQIRREREERGAEPIPELEDDDIDELAVSDDPDDQLRALLIVWPDFWEQDHGDAEWIAEPVIPAKRSVALFAPGGTGKSLLALWLAVHLAVGIDPFTGRRQKPIHVLYLDYEMTADDLAERLEQMGFGAECDLSRLHYALLPSLPGLDQPEGGKAVVRLAEIVEADLVVVDTFGRAVHGDENEADTVRAWYRWTGLHLKHAGRAFLRVDHAGKDLTKGQRGTSAKNDDVDVVWQMTAQEGETFKLTAKKRRMGWIPETVKIARLDDRVLRFGLVDGDTYPKGTKEVAQQLDELGIGVDESARKARRMLTEAGHGARDLVVRAAQKYRRQRSSTLHFVGDDPVTESGKARPDDSGRGRDADTPDAPPDAVNGTPTNNQVDEAGRAAGRGGTRPLPQMGASAAINSGRAQRDPSARHFEGEF